jgi:ferritin-like metal-binding protein YciE
VHDPEIAPEHVPGKGAALSFEEPQMSIENLHELFVHTLKDIHYAENKIYKSLPKMAKAVNDADLKKALEEHRTETEGQIERIKQVFKLLDMKPGSEECDAINGILEEGDGMMEDTDGSPMRNSAVIAAGQAVEHYEMVRYRSLVMWAGTLGLKDAIPLLQQSLDEEQRADEKLLKLAAMAQKMEGGDIAGSRSAGGKKAGASATGAKSSSGKSASGKAASGNGSAAKSSGGAKSGRASAGKSSGSGASRGA